MNQTSHVRNVAIVEASTCIVGTTLKSKATNLPDFTDSGAPDAHNTVVLHTFNKVDYRVNILENFDEDTEDALKLIDGIIVALNCTREPHPSTLKQLELVHKQLINTILMIDNVEEVLHYSASACFERLKRFSELIPCNNIVRDRTILPICFGSSKHGWAFSISQVAKLFAKKLDISEDKLQELFWGEYYYNKQTKEWTTTNDDTENCKHGFSFVYDMMKRILKVKDENLDTITTHFGIALSEEEKQLPPVDRFHVIMKKQFPIEKTLLDMIVKHLPSPINAQEKRCQTRGYVKQKKQQILFVVVQAPHISLFPFLHAHVKQLCSQSKKITASTIETEGITVSSNTYRDLKEFMNKLKETATYGVEFSTIECYYKETVTIVQDTVAMAKSPNHHNRIWLKCEPLDQQVVERMQTHFERDTLFDNTPLSANKRELWVCGDPGNPNIMMNKTIGVQYLNESVDSVKQAFDYATREGVLAAEPVIGVQYNMLDFSRVSDAIHRGGGQVIPMVRRCMYACQLMAEPRLVQPIMNVTIVLPEHVLGEYYGLLVQCRGTAEAEDHSMIQENTIIVKCTIPATSCVQFEDGMLEKQGCDMHVSFGHWEIIPDSPLHSGRVNDIVKSIRKRKGLVEEIPTLDRFLDRF
jgi:translation elongation factor EF-G